MFATSRPEPVSGVQIDPDVIEGCRSGNRAALDEVFRAYAPSLERLLARLVGPGADVEDLLQDTFAAAIEAFPRFRGEASVRSWLHQIAVHIAQNHLRRPRRRRETALETEVATEVATADEALGSGELARRLYDHLSKLETRKRIALTLYVIEGCSTSEIAALMGSSRAAAKSRIFWARRALLARLRRDPMFLDVRGDR